MRFLKKKLARAAQAKEEEGSIQQDQPANDLPNNYPRESFDVKTEETSIQEKKNSDSRKAQISSTKTIVKNYGKAIASFAINKIAKPYLSPLLHREGIKLKDFINHMSGAKESIEGIDTLRALLLVLPTDSEKQAGYKRIFRDISEVFIKFFSVNWIFSGRMVNKDAHLRYRFKMLRRIKNPEHFTYLK